MQEKNRYRIELIRDFSRYSLIGLLVFNILSAFAILFINAETFFLGQKIAGTPAVAYAVGLFLVTVILIFCLYRKSKGYGLITLVYGHRLPHHKPVSGEVPGVGAAQQPGF